MFVQTLKLILYINVWFIHILRRQTAFLFHTDTIIERSYLRRDIVGTERELYTRSFRFLNGSLYSEYDKAHLSPKPFHFLPRHSRNGRYALLSKTYHIGHSSHREGNRNSRTYRPALPRQNQIRSNIISIYACSSSIITSLFTHRCVRRPL